MSKGASAEQLRARLQGIDPYEFEHFVADLWEDRGWETEVSKGSRDQGVDIEARKLEGLVNQKAVIQAKRYADDNKVGRDEVQQYHSMKVQDSEADVAVIVTTSEFTTEARLWGLENNVKLVDGDDLVDLIVKHDRYDLLDEYDPDSDSEDEEPEQKPPEADETSSPASRSSQFVGTDYYGLVLGAFFFQVGGFAFLFVSSFPETAAALMVLLGMLGAPFSVFADANELHHKGADYRPNRVVWTAFVFMIPVVGLLFYMKKRGWGSS